jgi:hypothetical protein
LHKPKQVLEIRRLRQLNYIEAEKIESNVARDYIGQYGLNKVRGGDLVSKNNYTARFGRYF